MAFMEFINKYWSQIALLIGIPSALIGLYFKRKEMAYSNLKTNRISEIKLFLKALFVYLGAIKEYLHELKYPSQTESREFSDKVYRASEDFEYQAAVTKLFFENFERVSIQEIESALNLTMLKAKIVLARVNHSTNDLHHQTIQKIGDIQLDIEKNVLTALDKITNEVHKDFGIEMFRYKKQKN